MEHSLDLLLHLDLPRTLRSPLLHLQIHSHPGCRLDPHHQPPHWLTPQTTHQRPPLNLLPLKLLLLPLSLLPLSLLPLSLLPLSLLPLSLLPLSLLPLSFRLILRLLVRMFPLRQQLSSPLQIPRLHLHCPLTQDSQRRTAQDWVIRCSPLKEKGYHLPILGKHPLLVMMRNSTCQLHLLHWYLGSLVMLVLLLNHQKHQEHSPPGTNQLTTDQPTSHHQTMSEAPTLTPPTQLCRRHSPHLNLHQHPQASPTTQLCRRHSPHLNLHQHLQQQQNYLLYLGWEWPNHFLRRPPQVAVMNQRSIQSSLPEWC